MLYLSTVRWTLNVVTVNAHHSHVKLMIPTGQHATPTFAITEAVVKICMFVLIVLLATLGMTARLDPSFSALADIPIELTWTTHPSVVVKSTKMLVGSNSR